MVATQCNQEPDQAPTPDVAVALQRFGTYGRLKQVALRAVAHNFVANSELLVRHQTCLHLQLA